MRSVCDCIAIKDESVHVEIIKSLLTLAISPICDVKFIVFYVFFLLLKKKKRSQERIYHIYLRLFLISIVVKNINIYIFRYICIKKKPKESK